MMRCRSGIVAIAVALACGCGHAKSTDKGTSEAPPQEEAKQAKPRAASEGHAKQHGDAHAGKRDDVPVSTTPGGLLAPGAEDKIRERLAADGFLPGDGKSSEAAQREGLKRFQRAKDLPATGVPDHETVKRLGLDPNQIFSQGNVKD